MATRLRTGDIQFSDGTVQETAANVTDMPSGSVWQLNGSNGIGYSVPAWCNRIEIYIQNVTATGAIAFGAQLAYGANIFVNSGYNSIISVVQGTSTTNTAASTTSFTNIFPFRHAINQLTSGIMIIQKQFVNSSTSEETWFASGTFRIGNGFGTSVGTIVLPGKCTNVRLQTTGANFTAGTLKYRYSSF